MSDRKTLEEKYVKRDRELFEKVKEEMYYGKPITIIPSKQETEKEIKEIKEELGKIGANIINEDMREARKKLEERYVPPSH